ncbi:MAG: glycerophosphodiester phosphodiesterase [Geminicoccaceae bacterium]|nr:MAG: glycerophosphodiester phosphodiesterase [Geminicoccaceae bacterium]
MAFAFLDHPLPLAFAHRGGALEHEENTGAAFAHAVGLGYTHIETDVQATKDGVAVLFHDADLERMTGEKGSVGDGLWRELAQVRTLGGAPLLRLDELLEAYPDLHCNLEIKTAAAIEPMADVIRRTGALDRVCVGAFQARWTQRLRRLLGPGLCWSPAHAGVLVTWLRGWRLPLPAPAYPALQIPPAFRGIPLATRRFVRAAHRQGSQVHVWTVDDAAAMASLLDAGVDGLMTDRPTLLREVLERRGQWRGPVQAS